MVDAVAAIRERAHEARARIAAWLHGDGTGVRLAERLVAERGWTLEHARAAVEAYVCHLALEAIGRDPLPSIAVDAVAQVHALDPGHDTCWERAVGRTPRSLLVEDGFAALVRRWRAYATTLDAHEFLFGKPDPRLWPPVQSRYAAPGDFAAWAPEPRRRTVGCLGVVLGLAGLAAVATQGSWGWVMAGLGLVLLPIDLWAGNHLHRHRCPACDLGAMAALGAEPITPDLVLHGWRCGTCGHEAVEVRRGPGAAPAA